MCSSSVVKGVVDSVSSTVSDAANAIVDTATTTPQEIISGTVDISEDLVKGDFGGAIKGIGDLVSITDPTVAGTLALNPDWLPTPETIVDTVTGAIDAWTGIGDTADGIVEGIEEAGDVITEIGEGIPGSGVTVETTEEEEEEDDFPELDPILGRLAQGRRTLGSGKGIGANILSGGSGITERPRTLRRTLLG